MESKKLMDLLEESRKAFADFKKANDARLDAIEKKGSADPLLVERVEKANAHITELEQKMTELDTKAGRLPGTQRDEAADLQKTHHKAFTQFVRKGDDEGLMDLQMKSMAIGSNPDGGFAVPIELDRTITDLELNASPMRGLVEVQTVSNETYQRLINLHGTGSGWVGETDARTATANAQLAKVAPSFGEIYSNPFATQRSLDDVMFDVEAWLAGEVSSAFAIQEDSAIISGSGTNKPKGILSGSLATTTDDVRAFGTLQSVHSGTSGGFDFDSLISLVHSLRAGYRAGARFLMPTLTVAAARKVKDTQGRYIWEPSTQAGQPSSILGYPISEDENLPAIGAAANAILFGNFKRGYLLADVRGIRMLRDPFSNKPLVGFYTTKRLGGSVTDSNAIKVLTLSV